VKAKAVQAEKTENQGDGRVVLQVGGEFRVSNGGELILGNPELEPANHERAADATLLYRF